MTPDPTESLRLAQQAGEMDLDQFDDIAKERWAFAWQTRSDGHPDGYVVVLEGTVLNKNGHHQQNDTDYRRVCYTHTHAIGAIRARAITELPRILAELRRTRAERNNLRAELERVTRERDALQIRNKHTYEMNGELRDALTELVEAMESKDLPAFREAHIKSALTAAKDALK